MANEQNLKPMNKLTVKEQREIAQKGGKASAKKRKEKKEIKELFEMFLSLPIADDKTKANISKLGVKSKDIDNKMALIVALYKQALKGNVQAFNTIIEIIGEKPAHKIEISKNIDETILEIEEYIKSKNE